MKSNCRNAKGIYTGRIALITGLVLLFCMLGFASALADVLTLPAALTAIEDEAFMGNTAITSVVIPDGTVSIGARAFAGCSNLETVTIPDSVTTIADGAFEGCEGLKIYCNEGTAAEEYAQKKGIVYGEAMNTVIPEGLKYKRLYTNVQGYYMSITGYDGEMTSLVLPDEIDGIPVKEIASEAFLDNTFLKNVVMSKEIIWIEDRAFSGCSALEQVSFPRKLQKIKGEAFSGCVNLKRLDLPDEMSYIVSSAFSNCAAVLVCKKGTETERSLYSGHQTFTYPDQLDWRYCFNYDYQSPALALIDYVGSDTIVAVPEGATCLGNGLFSSNAEIGWVDIPDSVTRIENYAFHGCSNLKEIHLPNHISFIGNGVFDDTVLYSTLGSVTSYALSNKGYDFSIDNNPDFKYIYSDGKLSLSRYTGLETRVTVPSVVKKIEAYAFCPINGSCVEHVQIPEGVEEIGQRVFYGCSSLISVTFPNTASNFGGGIFENCFKLETAVFPDYIDESMMDGLMIYATRKAKYICSMGSMTAHSLSKEYYSFCDRENMDWSYQYFDDMLYLIKYYGDERVVVIPDGPDAIYSGAFSGNESLRSVQIPDGVSDIYDEAFSNCSSLTSIGIPDSVTSIWDGAFDGCGSLTIYGEPGSYAETYAAENGYAFSTEPMPGTGTANITVSGTVISSDGSSPENVWVALQDSRGNTWSAVSGEDGSWSITDEITAGTSTLSFRKYGYALSPEKINITTGSQNVQTQNVYVSKKVLHVPVIYEPDADEVIQATNTVLRWDTQEPANGYRISLYEVTDGAETAVFTDVETSEVSYKLSLTRGKTYRTQVTAYNNEQELSSSAYFRVADENELTGVSGFAMSHTTVQTCDPVTFTILAPGASYVQMMVNGEGYEQALVDNNGQATMIRAFTQSGERCISFRAMKGGVYGPACEEQVLTVTASGQLDSPEVMLSSSKVYLGDAVTVEWTAVEHADGYYVYLFQPDGTSTRSRVGSSEHTAEIPAYMMQTTGEYIVLVMPYGTNHDQSEGSAIFNVTDAYRSWQGWPQQDVINYYADVSTGVASGTLEHTQGLEVLGEEGDYYLVRVIDTNTQVYVRKIDAGTEPYEQELTLKAYYKTENGGKTLTLVTSRAAVMVGIERGDFAEAKTKPDAVSSNSYTFRFYDTPEPGTAVYTVWAKNIDGDTISSTLTVPVAAPEETITPEVTPTPETTETPETTISPEQTPTPTPTRTPTTVTPTPVVCPVYEQYGRHSEECSANLYVQADTKGNIRFVSGQCSNTEETVMLTTVPLIQLEWNAPLLGANYYATSAVSYDEDQSRYRQITIQKDLIVDADTDWSNADLVVNGSVTVEANLKCRSIQCSDLTIKQGAIVEIAEGGLLTVNWENGHGKIRVEGSLTGPGEISCYALDLKDTGLISVTENATIKVITDAELNERLIGGKKLTCENLNVKASGQLRMSSGFSIEVANKFKFASERIHSPYFTDTSTITIGAGGSVDINGNCFQFNGTMKLKDNDTSISMQNALTENGNYIATLELLESVVVCEDEEVKGNYKEALQKVAKAIKGRITEEVMSKIDEVLKVLEIRNYSKEMKRYYWADIPNVLNGRMPVTTPDGKLDEHYYLEMVRGITENTSIEDAADIIYNCNYAAWSPRINFNDTYEDRKRFERAACYGMASLFMEQRPTIESSMSVTRDLTQVYSQFDSYYFDYDGVLYKIDPTGVNAHSYDASENEITSTTAFLRAELYSGNVYLGTLTYTPSAEQMEETMRTLVAAGSEEFEALLNDAYEEVKEAAWDLLGLKKIISYVSASDVQNFYDRLTFANKEPTLVDGLLSVLNKNEEVQEFNKIMKFYNKWKKFNDALDASL